MAIAGMPENLRSHCEGAVVTQPVALSGIVHW